MIRREVREGTQNQGEDERIAYVIDVSTWGTGPGAPANFIYDVTGGGHVDTSAVNLIGVPSVAGDTVITSRVIVLTAGRQYRLDVQFTMSGNVYEAYILINAEV